MSSLVSPSQLPLAYQKAGMKGASESTVNLIREDEDVAVISSRMTAMPSSFVSRREVASHTPVISLAQKEYTGECGDIKSWFRDNSDSLPRYFCMMIFALIACYQVSDQIQQYMSYPTGVNVLVEEPKSMREALPGVTICHNNRFLKSKIREELQKWLVKQGMDKNYTPKTRFEDYNLTYSFLHAKENEKLYGIWASIEHMFNYTIEAVDFIPFLKCDQSWKQESDIFKECEEYPVIESLQYTGRCFTLFHAMSTEEVGKEIGIRRLNNLVRNPKTSIEDFVQRNGSSPEPTSPSSSTEANGSITVVGSLQTDKTQAYDFAASEIIQMMVDFHPEESTDPYAPVGGKIYIHDFAHIPGLEEMYFDLQPGYYYELYIRAITTKQLPPPYNTRCTNYTKVSFEWIKNFKMVGGIASSQVECINLCLAEQSIADCGGIWPPEVPVFRKSKYSNKTWYNEHYKMKHGIRWGGWKDRNSQEGDHHHYFLCVSLYKPMCMNRCGVDCL